MERARIIQKNGQDRDRPGAGESLADRMVEEMWAEYRKTLKAPNINY